MLFCLCLLLDVKVCFMDRVKILVWHVRGLNSSARQSAVLRFVRDHQISIVCFRESKVESVSLQLVAQCCGPKFNKFLVVPSVGASGGLVTAWDDSEFEIDQVAASRNFLLAVCNSKESGKSWHLCNVYGPQGMPTKEAC